MFLLLKQQILILPHGAQEKGRGSREKKFFVWLLPNASPPLISLLIGGKNFIWNKRLFFSLLQMHFPSSPLFGAAKRRMFLQLPQSALGYSNKNVYLSILGNH